MILFDLKCGEGHVFEAWFRNSGAYEAQAAANEIACPICGDIRIAKAPMAPRIGKSRQEVEKTETAALRRAESCANLSNCAARSKRSAIMSATASLKEARRIHYGEIEKRDIYGEATETETTELRRRDRGRTDSLGSDDILNSLLPQSGPPADHASGRSRRRVGMSWVAPGFRRQL